MSGYSLVFDAASNLRKVGACGMSERCRAPGSRFHLASMLLRCHEVCLHNMSLLHTFATILLWCWVCVVSDCASLYQPSKPWIRDIWSHVDGAQRLSWWCVGTVMPTVELANNDNPWSKDLKSRTASLKVLLTCFWHIYDLRHLWSEASEIASFRDLYKKLWSI